MECSETPRDERYRARYSKIPELVRSAEQKFPPPRGNGSDKVRAVLALVAKGEKLPSRGADEVRELISRQELSEADGKNALQALDIIAQKTGLTT